MPFVPPARYVRQARFGFLPITFDHAAAAGALPGPHRDPFDRMLIAQSRIEELPVITVDPVFEQDGCRVVW